MKTHCVCIPTLPGTVPDELVGTLMNCVPLWHGYLTERGNSSIALARNNMADTFLKGTKFDSMIFIDSDILFTRQDFEYLLEGPEIAVTAEYAKKDDTGEVAHYGLGFARIDRYVFDALRDLNLTQEFFVPGWNRVMRDYFINGAARSMQEGGMATWVGEDTGFWGLVKQANIPVRVETRTDLGHVGRKVYRVPKSITKDGAFRSSEPPMTAEEKAQWDETCRIMGSIPSRSVRSTRFAPIEEVVKCTCQSDAPESNPYCKVHGVTH